MKQIGLSFIQENTLLWSRLQQPGIDLIKTDKVGECREFFLTQRKEYGIHTNGHVGLLRNDRNTDHRNMDKTDSQIILCVITLPLFF